MEDFFSRLWDILTYVFGGVANVVERSVTGLFGSSNARYLKKLQPQVDAINALEPKYQEMTDEELKEQTAKFRKRLAAGETLDDLLIEAFAVCREAGRRYLGMRHFDVQLMGGIVLHRGSIAEMVTGEGKTLVATLPTYLNALQPIRKDIEGHPRGSVHVVTVNDYLARRDMEWMGPLYMSLGLTVGRDPVEHGDVGSGRGPMPATSPTGRTTSSGSTICATTCGPRRRATITTRCTCSRCRGGCTSP